MFSFLSILFFLYNLYIHIYYHSWASVILSHSFLFYYTSIVFLGQYTDDSKTIHRIQQQTGLESDDEHTTSGMFQANYQYTPLKEYAAMKSGRTTTNDTNTNGYQSK